MSNKETYYIELIKQLKAVSDPEIEWFSNWCQMLSLMKQKMNFFWVGTYLVKDNHLYLGPFQGLAACTRINWGKGACGKAAKFQKTIIIDDVSKFEGYIACHHETASEIVVPAVDKNANTLFVLDIDSTEVGAFDEIDKNYLEEVALIFLEGYFSRQWQ